MSNDPLREGAGLLRIAASAGWSTAQWVVHTTVHTGSRVVRGLASGESPVKIAGELGTELRDAARSVVDPPATEPRPTEHQSSVAELRARGAELLRRSADVHFVEDMHPAYDRILGELTPDEARILRFLSKEGPQPTVDVRTSRPLGIGSVLIEAGLSMIGRQAGVRNLSRTNAYLNNLFRLGLVWFSREEVEPSRYQVVEVQPEVQAAMAKAGRAPRTVRRSIHLTPFGEDFCHTCLPLDT
ncbi:Abi-alpha family protein [Actinophytocola sp.]|uniref:Abi-alpha family protein n=1 Tax=Actinophytocola sp. TaxID=1872138 RepID=UPI003D6B1FC0